MGRFFKATCPIALIFFFTGRHSKGWECFRFPQYRFWTCFHVSTGFKDESLSQKVRNFYRSQSYFSRLFSRKTQNSFKKGSLCRIVEIWIRISIMLSKPRDNFESLNALYSMYYTSSDRWKRMPKYIIQAQEDLIVQSKKSRELLGSVGTFSFCKNDTRNETTTQNLHDRPLF